MTDAASGEYDAHETAKPAEPTFTLQGGDPFAPATVKFWVEKARAAGRSILVGDRAHFEVSEEIPVYTPTAQDMADAGSLFSKATSAEGVLWEMEAYQRGDVAPAETRAAYNDQATAEVAADFDARKAMIRSVTGLNNAVAQINDVAGLLASFSLHPETEVALRGAVEALRLAALTIDPRKANERT